MGWEDSWDRRGRYSCLNHVCEVSVGLIENGELSSVNVDCSEGNALLKLLKIVHCLGEEPDEW